MAVKKVAKKVVAKKKAPVKKVVAKKKPAAKKVAVKKAAPKKVAAKKVIAKKVVAKKKAPVKKVVAKKKPAAKKVVVKKAAPKKVVAKKVVAKKPIPAKIVPLKSKKVVSSSQKGLKQFRAYEAKKGENYMSKSQLNHFRTILNEWKTELSQDIDRTVHTMQDELTSYADPNDRASQESDMALELRNRDRERKLIKKIDETLRNIESQDYGYCTGCGEEIGLKRLEARPTATLCIDCKTLDEIREKQMAG
ncbi:RNA polymerase-binding protein DksA [Candidatus Methylopumilus rimovensis]|uniref:RNA polymerase-binding transcription factor DksA n=2 Tax=Candidatus Methylopumilus rimovensis TaxID=2588535 RepID=A0AAE6FS18_9PROT|nr:RNA polymerase-binding protein DksA [Candidatus Methylopumilus rimovensis]QDD12940.1 RNA polymerase-binding protein DksA [Candidatus Methylopumilus rimovensis]